MSEQSAAFCFGIVLRRLRDSEKEKGEAEEYMAERNEKKKMTAVLLVLLLTGLGLYGLVVFLGRLQVTAMESPKKNEIYGAYYVLIEDGHDSTLWDSIYEGARKEGEENCNAYVEYLGKNLTADYTDVTGYYSTHFPHISPPYVREATAHFMRRGKHYLVTSGTTGYLPNPSEVAMADTWHGPYAVLGNPHPGDESRTSFHSQISSVFQVEGKKDLYIAVADRWVPDHMELRYEEYAAEFERIFDPDYDGEIKFDEKFGMDGERDTSIADYVWLPFRFEGDRPYLDWTDEWRIEDFD